VPERLLLVGMMGAGKSTVARLTAQRLGWSWIDTDDVIVRRCGTSVADLFATEGESAFRREEASAVAEVLDGTEPLVVSVGGGAVLDPVNRQALRGGGKVVWLRARPETLMERVRDGSSRPLLAGSTPAQRAETLRQLDDRRRPLYAEVAHDVVDVDGIDAGAVAGRLLELVGHRADDDKAPDRKGHT
jgi:shikimate kinase